MKNKIMMIIPSLGGGGAEKVLLIISNRLIKKGNEVVVVSLESTNDYRSEMPQGISVYSLNKRRKLDLFFVLFKLIKIIKKENPSIIMSFMIYCNFLNALVGRLKNKKRKLLFAEHTNASHYLKYSNFRYVKERLMNLLYPKADYLVAVSNGIMTDMIENLKIKIDQSKCRVIYNPIDVEKIGRKALEKVEHRWFNEDVPIIIACGRLEYEKNYPMMLRVFKALLNHMPARLVILGQGKEKTRLMEYSKELGVNQYVAFLGFQENPYKYMARSNIFLMSSCYEGFPNVILEAMACGIPVISTNCPSGPEEAIDYGKNGILVPMGDESKLKQALVTLLQDESLRKRFIEAGKVRVHDFEVDKTVREYEDLLVI